MRNSVVSKIYEYAKINKNVVFLTADLGYSVIEEFQSELPDQCVNMGISEQNMVGVAAGLALEGKKVFVYSIVPFATMRCFEQIRVDICYQNLDVTIIGIGGGFAYGTLGTTHHAIEDVGIMRTLPNMKIFAPADPYEAAVLMGRIFEAGGPSYVRLNRGGESCVFKEESKYRVVNIGRANVLRNGGDASILACGDIVKVALEAAERLSSEHRIEVQVVSVHTLKPIDVEYIKKIALEVNLIITLEEHNIIGGLGSAVSEILAEENTGAAFKRLGVQDVYPTVVGKQEFLRRVHNISVEDVINTVVKHYEKSISDGR